MNYRRLFSVLAAISACFTALAFLAQPPALADTVLLYEFSTNRAFFGELRRAALYDVDGEVVTISPSVIPPEIPFNRMLAYRQAFHDLNVKMIVACKKADLRYQSVIFVLDKVGFVERGGLEKGVLWSALTPRPVVDDLDEAYVFHRHENKPSKFAAYRHIENGWYLYAADYARRPCSHFGRIT